MSARADRSEERLGVNAYEASTVAPLDYSSMILAVINGYAFFGEVPTLSVWIGAPLVVGAGLLILWREYSLEQQLSAASTEAE